jgi:hypothetical protein
MGVVDWFSQNINALLNSVLVFLPSSPFRGAINSIPGSVLAAINWVIDFNGMANLLAAWIACVSIFYVFRIVLAWAKAIGD